MSPGIKVKSTKDSLFSPGFTSKPVSAPLVKIGVNETASRMFWFESQSAEIGLY